ncbi:MAG TPA: caspase family protein, partial [Polyangiaceae bacterium]|nr:caspase family protein [Polyangiaceae bacterium]
MRALARAVVLAVLTQGCGGATSSSDAPEGALDASRIWSIAIGVSQYQHTDLSLDFAHRDAAAIDAFFASSAGGEVPAERRVLLLDDQATRSATLTALNDFARRSAPEDMLVLFFAMHGFPDAGGDLYFLTYDTDPKQLVGTGLPQRDVEYVLRRAGAERIVLL